MINTPISYGELVDKLTILAIKVERISDPAKLGNIRTELELLSVKYTTLPMSDKLIQLRAQLKTINEIIWDIEDDIRDCERRKDFSDKFVQLARGVYLNNDERSRIKRQINDLLHSNIIEEKSYTEYQ